ncbi:MAG TPA: HupE/UreJ family protein [Candidatus Eisenbacteria bacterium]|nr:HupE/UreJ family protein [Candidatus Eisenbacteria bacterium]
MRLLAPIAAGLAVTATLAGAHAMAPALLEIAEQGSSLFTVTWKTSLMAPTGVTLQPILPADCADETARTETPGVESITTRWTVRCTRGLAGGTVGVDGLATGKTDALVRIAFADGRRIQGVVRASEPRLSIPARPAPWAVLASYGKLGVEHILTGPDHLLFVLGLLLIVMTPRLLVKTITAFTLAHSVTLSLAILGVVAFPSRVIEVGIAASVFLLAVELTRAAPPSATWLRRAPWIAAGAFGLLHGLGFAGALAEVGLPAGEIPLALFSFNLGIEVGQLAFVALVSAAGWLVVRTFARRPVWLTLAPAYVMGSLSALWCLERAALLVVGR